MNGPRRTPSWVCGRGERLCAAAFAAALLVFTLASLRLAGINRSPGEPDSRATLHMARNALTGRGLVNYLVGQHIVPEVLPHPPNQRQPSLPLLYAALFKAFGVSLKIPVLLNALTVAATALLLVVSLRAAGMSWFGYLGGALLLVSGNYEMLSALNNNLLVLCATGLLLAGTRYLKGQLTAPRFAAVCGVIGGAGYVLKPTFITTALPFTSILLLTENGEWRGRLRRAVLLSSVMLAVAAALSSPYWLGSLLRHGTPIYTIQPQLRLSERYGGLPHGTFETVRYGSPVTYAELIRLHGGVAAFARKEAAIWYHAVKSARGLNPYLWLIAALGATLCVSKGVWRWYAMGAAAMLSCFLFPAVYWGVEDRYLWPVFPWLIYMAGLAIRDGRGGALAAAPATGLRIRLSILLAVALAMSGVFGWRYCSYRWRAVFFREARAAAPEWVTVLDRIPPDAVVLTTDPWSLAWYWGNRSVILPRGSRNDLLEVVRRYRPGYVLDTAGSVGTYAFRVKRDLTPLSVCRAEGRPWGLYRINESFLKEAASPEPDGDE